MYQDLPDNFDHLERINDFRDVLQTILDNPRLDRFPEKESMAPELRRRPNIPEDAAVIIPQKLLRRTAKIFMELREVKGGLFGTTWDTIAGWSGRLYLESQGSWRWTGNYVILSNFACCPARGVVRHEITFQRAGDLWPHSMLFRSQGEPRGLLIMYVVFCHRVELEQSLRLWYANQLA
eukprot:s3420_g1.t1